MPNAPGTWGAEEHDVLPSGNPGIRGAKDKAKHGIVTARASSLSPTRPLPAPERAQSNRSRYPPKSRHTCGPRSPAPISTALGHAGAMPRCPYPAPAQHIPFGPSSPPQRLHVSFRFGWEHQPQPQSDGEAPAGAGIPAPTQSHSPMGTPEP